MGSSPDDNAAKTAKEMVLKELQKTSTGTGDSGGTREREEEDGDQDEPPPKRPQRVQAHSSLDSMFQKIAGERQSSSTSAPAVTGAIQLETYLSEDTIGTKENPLKYLCDNKGRFPTFPFNLLHIILYMQFAFCPNWLSVAEIVMS